MPGRFSLRDERGCRSPNHPLKGPDETQRFVGDAAAACGEVDTVVCLPGAPPTMLTGRPVPGVRETVVLRTRARVEVSDVGRSRTVRLRGRGGRA